MVTIEQLIEEIFFFKEKYATTVYNMLNSFNDSLKELYILKKEPYCVAYYYIISRRYIFMRNRQYAYI